MKQIAKRILHTIRWTRGIMLSRLGKQHKCSACGFRGSYLYHQVLWPELIEEWQLSEQWAHWFDEREGAICASCGSNLRCRQLAQAIITALSLRIKTTADSLSALFDEPCVANSKIAEINSAGALHRFLSKSKGLKYSEFCSTTAAVPCEDLMHLSYADSSFDLVITSETLEHVPNVDVALREIYRILRPSGLHIFTVPMVTDRPQTRQRAYIGEDGALVHLLPPSYHGSPEANKSDLLVFNEFGIDFLERCSAAGFDTHMSSDKENAASIAFTSIKQR